MEKDSNFSAINPKPDREGSMGSGPEGAGEVPTNYPNPYDSAVGRGNKSGGRND